MQPTTPIRTCGEIPAKSLAGVRDTHQWALGAAALLEENIEFLSHSVSCRQSGSHRQSGAIGDLETVDIDPSQWVFHHRPLWWSLVRRALLGKPNHPDQLG